MSDFKWFKSTLTGKTGRYPAHFADRPTFEEVDKGDDCVDCVVDLGEEVELPPYLPETPYEFEEDED